ncbi:MAG: aspartate aminotransferase family protein [Hyphomicrobiaceae bacterium]
MNIMSNLPPTSELQALDAGHHLHPFCDPAEMNVEGATAARVITQADGIYLWDSDGNRILDGMAGLWCVNAGYGRNEIADAAHRQMTQLPYYNTFFKTTHPPAIALAEKIASLAPAHMNHVFFSNSGSEANDTNVRLVRHYWASVGQPEKSVIIARRNAYHGSTMAAASLGGMSYMHEQGGMPIPDIVHIDQPYVFGEAGDQDPEAFGLACAQQLEAKIDELGEGRVAAFIGEPIQGAGGVIIPPATYWPEIQRICRERNILLISDEVICGFGRMGAWFGCTTYNVTPDIITIAKGLSSGYLPVAGVIVSDKIVEGLQKGGEFNHGYTYSGHPAACAAALANIEIFEREGIIDRVANETGPYFCDKWLTLGDHPLVGEARAHGMLGAIELVADKATNAPFPEPGNAGALCRDMAIASGLIMRAVFDRMVISPPLIITTEQIDELVTLARTALDLTWDKLKADGHVAA